MNHLQLFQQSASHPWDSCDRFVSLFSQTRNPRGSGDMPSGIFTKIPAGNPVKTPSHAVNSKPAAFIGWGGI